MLRINEMTPLRRNSTISEILNAVRNFVTYNRFIITAVTATAALLAHTLNTSYFDSMSPNITLAAMMIMLGMTILFFIMPFNYITGGGTTGGTRPESSGTSAILAQLDIPTLQTNVSAFAAPCWI